MKLWLPLGLLLVLPYGCSLETAPTWDGRDDIDLYKGLWPTRYSRHERADSDAETDSADDSDADGGMPAAADSRGGRAASSGG